MEHMQESLLSASEHTEVEQVGFESIFVRLEAPPDTWKTSHEIAKIYGLSETQTRKRLKDAKIKRVWWNKCWYYAP